MPSGKVTVMVQLPVSVLAKISMICVFAASPIPCRVSPNFAESCSNTVARGPHCGAAKPACVARINPTKPSESAKSVCVIVCLSKAAVMKARGFSAFLRRRPGVTQRMRPVRARSVNATR